MGSIFCQKPVFLNYFITAVAKGESFGNFLIPLFIRYSVIIGESGFLWLALYFLFVYYL